MTRATSRAAAALCAGFGGIAFETAVLRRFGLVLGNTAQAAAVVIAAFLVGLGMGGLVAGRLATTRPLRTAGAAYLLAAGGIVAADLALLALPPTSFAAGLIAALVLVGGPAVAMGAAFPLLFQGLEGRRAPGGLVAVNLAGSVVAAWLAGNLLVPELGCRATQAIAAVAYALAALAVWSNRGAEAATVGSSPRGLAPHARLAFAAGAVVVGYEILLLRRLPFFLEGFQPTLSGVLASCLLALAVGAWGGPWLARRAAGTRAPSVALLLAAPLVCLGLQEVIAPRLARTPVATDLGLHLRILAATLGSAAPALIAAGAVVPLSLGAFEPEERGRAAGFLFLAQGLGALAGALLVGHALPAVAPAAFFVATPVALGLVAATGALRARPAPAVLTAVAVVALGLTGVAGPGTLLAPAPPVRGSRFDRPDAYRMLEHRTDATTTASVVYDRSNHSMVLFTDEFRAAYTGPGTSYMKVLGHLPFVLREGLRDVAVIALGTGTTADAVRAWPDPAAIHVVEISAAVLGLVDRFAGDGPVESGKRAPFAVDPRTEVHVTDGRRWLATRAAESLDLVTMEPLLPYAPGTAPLYSAEFYALVRSRLRAGGLCVQWVPTHAMPRAMFETLLGTFGDAFPSTSVWLVDQSTLLVGSMSPHLPSLAALEARLAAAPSLAARTLQEAGIASVADLLAAHVGVAPRAAYPGAPALHDDRPFLERIGYWSGEERLSFYPDNLDALARLCGDGEAVFGGAEQAARRRTRLGGLAERARAILDPTGERARAALSAAARLRVDEPRSVVLHTEETLALRAVLEAELCRMPPVSAAPIARRQIERDPAFAPFVALAGADRAGAAARSLLECAIAVDPTVPERAPWAVGWAAEELPAERRSPLEDLAELPAGAALAELAARADARGFAVRAMFGVRCARALVDVGGRRTLTEAERAALRQVLDPASLEAFGRAVSARSGDVLAEVGPAWRRDLPMPSAVAALGAGPVDARRGLAEALAERRGVAELDALAELLVDADVAVRRSAAAALFRTFGDAVPYDPLGPETDRRRAAARLRALHNRRP